jgi:uncharacterized protein
MNKIYFILLFSTKSYFGFGQNEKSLLWEISSDSLGKKSYLYGTVHSICEKSVRMTPIFKNIISSSEEVYLEINFDEDLNEFKSQYDTFIKNGKSLSSYYTDEQYARLEKIFNRNLKARGINLGQFKNYKPNEILPMIIPDPKICTKWTSYEEQISKVAKRKKIVIRGIETFEEHNSLEEESDSSIAKNAKYFFELVVGEIGRDSIRNDYYRMIDMYKFEDIDALYSFSSKDDPSHSAKVLDFRNKIWIPKIKKISATKSVLYAVGAAHLAGENGVINLLRKEGYTVKPVWD